MLLQALEDAGLGDDTLIIFLSDNGPHISQLQDNAAHCWSKAASDRAGAEEDIAWRDESKHDLLCGYTPYNTRIYG